jgi:hypothetical protein
VSERWRHVDPALGVEEDETSVYETRDGRTFGNVRIIDTTDNIARMRLGRMCANCREPFEIPWPVLCPVCGIFVREQQADFFERMYAGSVDLPSGFDVEAEIALLRETLERQEKEEGK